MKAASLASGSDFIVCPVCEKGELHPFGGESARCGRCGYIVGAAMLLTVEVGSGKTTERARSSEMSSENRGRDLAMVGHSSVLEQVDADFSGAHRRALLRRVADLLRRETASGGLLCFDRVRRVSGAVGWIHRGARTVPVGQISGSVGRCSEFDRNFMPVKASAEERWKRVDHAFRRGEELPAVSLYKVGGAYFVLDGHHRVSVARYHGVEWIDADVTELRAGYRAIEGTTRMREMMDLELARQRRAEMLREVATNRRAKELPATRGRGAAWRSALAWEIKRHAGRLLKLFRASRRAG